MAVIIRRIFGNPSGKFGQSIFRNRYGKIVAYSKPANQRVSKSEAAKEARKQFALTVAFAKIINGMSVLSEVWRNAKMPGTSAYHKIIKHNNSLTSGKGLTIKNIITPPCNYSAIDEIHKTKYGVIVSFSKMFKETIIDSESNAKLCIIIYLHNAFLWILPEFRLSGEVISLSSHIPLNEIEVKLPDVPFNMYNNATIYASVYHGTNTQHRVRCSNTYAKEI